MLKIDELYPKLAEAVRQDHVTFNMMSTGHSFDHPLTVARYCPLIAPDEETGRIAGAAGLCHNADRLLKKRLGDVNKAKVPESDVVAMVLGWLSAGEHFSEQEVVMILRAVQKHSGFNLTDGDLVLITLQDADRVACSSPEQIMGAAQFRPNLPTIHPKWLTADPNDPTANPYRNPKSVLHSMECWRDWIDPNSKVCVRLPKARRLIEDSVALFEFYKEKIRARRADIRLHPDYPFDEPA